ncbi:MAG: cellulase family glycosylhydrolase [Candidatus Yanofskybacteria bacterium]|nr:cellulase family glycosylhydrolase [Candidatus Yanofskybacteria bacterium]
MRKPSRPLVKGSIMGTILIIALVLARFDLIDRTLALLFGINSSQINRQRLSKISQLNADIVRLDAFSWDLIEKEKGIFDFSVPDEMMALARKNKVQVLGILQYSPAWASFTNATMPTKFSSHCGLPDPDQESYDKYRAYPPLNNSDFATFIYMTVKRYPDVKYWQIWNEPNNPVFWRGHPRADQYVAMLKEAYDAVKRANPNAQVVFGGLSLNDQEYMEKIYEFGGKSYFDIMAVHPYNPSQAPSQYLEFEMKKLKQFMENRNDGQKEIWITEIGWPTSTGGISEKMQAQYIEETYKIAGNLGFIGAVFWQTIADCTGDFDKAVDEENYGLFRSDWSPKPGVQKYRDIVN